MISVLTKITVFIFAIIKQLCCSACVKVATDKQRDEGSVVGTERQHAALMACFLLALVAAQSYTMDRITCTSSNFVFFADGLNLVHFSFTLIPLYVLLGPEQALASAFIYIFPRRSHNMQTARVIKKKKYHVFFLFSRIFHRPGRPQ